MLQVNSLPADPQGKPKNTRVGCNALLQGIFPTQGSNSGLQYCRLILYRLGQSEKYSLPMTLVAQLVKNPPGMPETPVWFPGQKDSLEKGWATSSSIIGLPWWLRWWRIHLQRGRPEFNPWVGKIPWRRERLPTPVFWPREFCGLYNPWGRKASGHNWGIFTFQ